MKTITIGRDVNNSIIIDNQLISRKHALIRINSLGQMKIIDLSSNGTYINGIRMKPNTPVPVSRKDMISFAHAKQLDWEEVPNPLSWLKWAGYIILGIVALIIILQFIPSKKFEIPENPQSVTVPSDNQGNGPSVIENSKAKVDSVAAGKKDTVRTSKMPRWAEKELNKKKTQKSAPKKSDKENTKASQDATDMIIM